MSRSIVDNVDNSAMNASWHAERSVDPDADDASSKACWRVREVLTAVVPCPANIGKWMGEKLVETITAAERWRNKRNNLLSIYNRKCRELLLKEITLPKPVWVVQESMCHKIRQRW